MKTLDIIISCFLGYGFLRGIWKGFFYELASLLSLLVGVYVTFNFSYWVKNWIIATFDYQSQYMNIIAFVITFVTTVLAIMGIASFLTKIANLASLGLFNKLVGGVFGFLKLGLILSIGLYFFSNLNKSNAIVEQKVLDDSILYEPVLMISIELYPIIKQQFPVIEEEEKK